MSSKFGGPKPRPKSPKTCKAPPIEIDPYAIPSGDLVLVAWGRIRSPPYAICHNTYHQMELARLGPPETWQSPHLPQDCYLTASLQRDPINNTWTATLTLWRTGDQQTSYAWPYLLIPDIRYVDTGLLKAGPLGVHQTLYELHIMI